MSNQYLRRSTLVVMSAPPAAATESVAGSNPIPNGLDLSTLHFTFKTTQSDTLTPNTMVVRIFNLSDATLKRIKKEFNQVILSAGYENGNYGVVFNGVIKQVRSGRLPNNVDTFCDLLCADDIFFNYAILNTTLAAQATSPAQVLAAIQGSGTLQAVGTDVAPNTFTGGVLPRGKVMYGMTSDHLETFAATHNYSASVQNGKLVVLPFDGYRPGEAVVLTAATGLIGAPEQTDSGISLKCLLNPLIKIGGLVKIDNSLITQTTNTGANPEAVPYNQRAGVQLLPTIANDGVYRVYVIEHEGDTRGTPWYSDIIALSVDASAPPGSSVQDAGPG